MRSNMSESSNRSSWMPLTRRWPTNWPRPVPGTRDECGRLPMPGLEGGRSTPTIAKACTTRFLPADEFFDPRAFSVAWRAGSRHDTILAELETILADPESELTPYISLPPGVPANKWSGLDKSLDWGAFHLWKEGKRFDRGLRSSAAHGRLGGIASDLPDRGPRAERLFLDPEGREPYPGAHRGDQCAERRPPAADRSEGCEFRVGGETQAGSRARHSPSTTRSSMRRGTAANVTARS